MNFYNDAKRSVDIYRKKVLDVYSFSKGIDLNTVEIFSSYEYFKSFIEHINFTAEEEKYIGMLYSSNKLLSAAVKSWGKLEVYKLFIPGFTLEMEKNIYAKMMILESLKMFDCSDNFISNCIKFNATDELQNDKEFYEFAITLNGKYYQGFSDSLKDYETTEFAISNDKGDIPTSFLSAPIELQVDYNIALAYIKKLNKNYSIETIYNNLLKFTEKSDELYPQNNSFIGKNQIQIQRYWLSNPLFISGLVLINEEFNQYIMDDKIIKYGSSLENIEDVKLKKKGIIR